MSAERIDVDVAALARRRVTPSKLERAERCPWSACDHGNDRTGEWAERGTGVHTFLADAHAMGRDLALARIPHTAPHRKLAERIDVDALPWAPANLPPGATVHFERRLAYAPTTGAGRMLDRGEPAADSEMPGTPDVVVVTDAEAIVYDSKTGNPAEVTRPDDNRQLEAYAVAAGAVHGRFVVRTAIVQIYEDGSPFVVAAREPIDALRLAEIRLRILRVLDRVGEAAVAADPRPYMARGPWCRYCPRFVECPAQLAVLRALISALRNGEAPAIGVEHVSASRDFVRDASKWIDELKATIADYARVQAVPTSKPGVVYREFASTQRTIVDEPRALDVIRERYGDDVARAATQTSTTAIDRAVSDHARRNGRKIGAASEDAWSALKAAGVAADVPTTKVREGKSSEAA